jgi:hypothetical protein
LFLRVFASKIKASFVGVSSKMNVELLAIDMVENGLGHGAYNLVR